MRRGSAVLLIVTVAAHSALAGAAEGEPERPATTSDAQEAGQGSLAGAPEPAPVGAKDTRVLVLALETPDTPERQADLLYRSLVRELSKLEGVRIVEPPKIRAGPTAGGECPERTTSCLAALAKNLDADVVVTGNATALGDAKVLTLKRIRIQDATIQGAVTRQATGGSGEEYLLVLGEAVEELFVDYQMHSSAVRGVRPEVVARWSPDPLDPWMFYAGAGVTAAGLVTAVVFWSKAESAESDYKALAQKGLTEPVSGKELMELGDEAESRARMANVALGVTAALAIGTALTFTFVDWGSDEEITPLLVPMQHGGVAVGLAMDL